MTGKFWSSISMILFSFAIVSLFYFLLGWMVISDNYGSFSFLAIPGLLLMVAAFATQYIAIKKFRAEVKVSS